MKTIKKTKKSLSLIEHGPWGDVVRSEQLITPEEIEKTTEIKLKFKYPRLVSRVAFFGKMKKGQIKIIAFDNQPFIVGDNINTKKKAPTLKGDVKTIYKEGWDSGNFQPIMANKIIITAETAVIEEEVILGM